MQLQTWAIRRWKLLDGKLPAGSEEDGEILLFFEWKDVSQSLTRAALLPCACQKSLGLRAVNTQPSQKRQLKMLTEQIPGSLTKQYRLDCRSRRTLPTKVAAFAARTSETGA